VIRNNGLLKTVISYTNTKRSAYMYVISIYPRIYTRMFV